MNKTKENERRTYRFVWWQGKQKSRFEGNDQAKAEIARKKEVEAKKTGVEPVYIETSASKSQRSI
jgi:hypothetical protein